MAEGKYYYKPKDRWRESLRPVKLVCHGHGDFRPATAEDEANQRYNAELMERQTNTELRNELGMAWDQARRLQDDIEVWKTQFEKLKAAYHAIGGKGWD